MIAWLSVVALAGPDTPFARVGERIRTTNRRGGEKAWIAPDGVAVRRRLPGPEGTVIDHHQDASGHVVTTLIWRGDGLESATMVRGGPVNVDVTGWTLASPAPAFTMWSPDLPAPTAPVAGGVLRYDALDAMDPFAPTFEADLLNGAGGVLLDRSTEYVDGRACARFLIALPDGSDGQLVEVWAAPTTTALHVLSYRVPGADDDALAPGRVAWATWRWTK